VCYGELCVDDIAVEDRRIGYVPQGYGLFPHLTVWEQVNFGVGADPGLAAYWLRRLALNGLEQRYPDELSGGQCQRVALAQALARSPDLLLLDEPSAALDRPVRLELFAELRRLQRETAIPTVIVTHDSEEVAYLADEVIVLQDGQVLQTGSKEEVFTQPSSPEVARLVGVRNICEGLVDSNGMIQVSATRIEMDTDSLPPGTRVKWSIRPDEVMLTPEGPYAAVVLDRVDLGSTSELLLELSTGFELTASNLDREKVDLRPGARCRVALPPTQIKFWPIATETARLNVASASAEHP
jgi:molybdate transport system permease protein